MEVPPLKKYRQNDSFTTIFILYRQNDSFAVCLYYIDPTWGDASYQREEGEETPTLTETVNYDYFCVDEA